MALGLITESSGGSSGDFTPVIKYKANAGRFILVQRSQDEHTGEWSSADEDITRKLMDPKQDIKFLVDFGTIEVGYLDFGTGGAPVKLTAPLGETMPVKPDAKRKNAEGRMVDCFQQGFKLKLVSKAFANPEGVFVREFTSTSKACIGAIDRLHSAFEASPEAAEGKVPLVRFVDTEEVKTQTPKGTNTNYAPVFEIVGWADRNADMLGPRTVPAPAARQAAPVSAPPARGGGSAAADLNDEIPFGPEVR